MNRPRSSLLAEQAHALAIVPEHLDQSTAPAAKDEQMPAMRIEPQDLLHLQRQAVETLAHVGVAGRQPDPRARRKRDHRRRRGASTAPIAAATAAGSTVPLILTLVPPRSAISIEPVGGAGSTGGDPPRSSTVEDLGRDLDRQQPHRLG